MMKKITNPQFSKFEFDPRVYEINFFLDISLYFTRNLNLLGIDLNPLGDPKIVEISNLSLEKLQNGCMLKFSYKGKKETNIEIVSEQYCDLINFDTLFNIYNNGFVFHDKDNKDKFSVEFRQGKLERFIISKRSEGNVLNTLRITRIDGILRLIIPDPWERIVITQIKFEDEKLICLTEKGEHVYPLTLQKDILEILVLMLKSD